MAEIEHMIKVIKGHELDMEQSERIYEPAALMYPAFCKSLRAVEQIVSRTHDYHGKKHTNSEQVTCDLFGYSGNVIVFDAKWGGGKTRTMLSVGEFLNEPRQQDADSILENAKVDIQNERFYVLPPVAPAIMEKGQNILQVVLSRLYGRAQILLKEQEKHFDYRRDSEKTRSDLVRAFEDCLRGINGIKNPSSEDALSISSLQELSDGMALRNHFHELIQLILDLQLDGADRKNNFLILQLDDADSQIRYGYEVLEDVCKYLMIPNLIIFMSCEMQFMTKVVMQEHLSHFRESASNPQILIINDLLRKSQKYLDKMVPPANVIHLPEIDTLIEEKGNEIGLSYVEIVGGREKSLIPWAKGPDWNLQDTILMMVYRKTGIVFCKPRGYLHNLIPKTIRGINQMLYTLGAMEDLPSLGGCWSSVDSFEKRLMRRVVIEEKNLTDFEEYFMKSWLPAKISNPRDQAFLNDFYHSARKNGAVLALRYFNDRYCRKFSDKVLDDSLEKSLGEVQKSHASDFSQICIDDALKLLEKSHRTQDDFLLYFAIRTIRTIQCHKMVVQVKKETLKKYEQKKTGVILFDYDPEKTGLPTTYLLNPKVKEQRLNQLKGIDIFTLTEVPIPGEKLNGADAQGEQSKYQVLKDYWKTKASGSLDEAVMRLFKDTMTADSSENTLRLNVLNLITMDLVLGNSKIKFLTKDAGKIIENQQIVFETQEYALLIASNWDVQERVYKYLTVRKENETGTSENPVMDLFTSMDKAVQEGMGRKLWDAYVSSFFSGCVRSEKPWSFLYGDPPSFMGRLNQGFNTTSVDNLYFEMYVKSDDGQETESPAPVSNAKDQANNDLFEESSQDLEDEGES